jgi:hypothetical protein
MNSSHYFTPAAISERVTVALDRFAGVRHLAALRHVPRHVNLTVVTHVSPSGGRRGARHDNCHQSRAPVTPLFLWPPRVSLKFTGHRCGSL